MYVNKWHTFAAACLLQLVSGICYTFSLYSPELKHQLQYDQRQLQAVGAALLAGGYTSWIPGILCARVHTGSGLACQTASNMVAVQGSCMMAWCSDTTNLLPGMLELACTYRTQLMPCLGT